MSKLKFLTKNRKMDNFIRKEYKEYETITEGIEQMVGHKIQPTPNPAQTFTRIKISGMLVYSF